MKRSLPTVFLICLTGVVSAEWQFTPKLDVAPQQSGDKIFHHLDTTGRANIAISGEFLAVVWEDNHTGSAQTYVAYKNLSDKVFSRPARLSTGEEAYEPGIIALGKGRFAIAWEQDGQIWMRIDAHGQPGQPIRLSQKAGRQVTLVSITDQQLQAAWTEDDGSNSYIATAMLSLNNASVQVGPIAALDRSVPDQRQSYPVLAKTGNTIGIVWEDRRRGHTILVYSTSVDGKSFSTPTVLNEIVKKSETYGKGSGVTRVALASYGKGQLAATWMDKRNQQTGYDIYAALDEQGKFVFGKNQQVQDGFGDNLAQWNPAIAGSPQGDVAVVWYDNREESMDILLSTKTDTAWSDDLIVPPASGEGDQTNAVIAFDKKRNLHMVWIDQATSTSPTRLYYSVGKSQ